MYHHHLRPSVSSSTSSSYTSRMILLDHEDQYFARDSMLLKKAKKQQMKKRRESIGEVILPQKTPCNTSIMPRRTQSSILQPSSSSQIKQQCRRKYHSLQQPLTQHEKSTLASFDKGVHWDPHIDAFEIIRAKITGITRSMQQFHVQELFQNDFLLAEGKRRRTLTFPNVTKSSPLITCSQEATTNFNDTNHAYEISRRIRSKSSNPWYEMGENHSFIRQGHFLAMQQKDEEEEEENVLASSPNLTTLFLTTNNLISSRLDELSETATCNEEEYHLEWQKDFLKLVTQCIHQSEALEQLSTDALQMEHRLRELMLIKDNLNEQFQEREKQYEERIRECQEIAQQQLILIDSLEELNADIDMKLESHRREMHRQALDVKQNYNENEDRWDFQKSVADLLHMGEKHETIQKMRWEIGMFVGGGVGTGHIIHSFEDKLSGMDIVIAGTGTTSSSPREIYHQMHPYDIDETQPPTISASIHHIKLYQHKYILHLSHLDRRTRFALLPKCLWVPDTETNQCQFHNYRQCSTKFSFFRRKHHCRKCGLIICQRHSANRLPLFSPSKPYATTGKWSRVCDTCFHDLIVHKSKP